MPRRCLWIVFVVLWVPACGGEPADVQPALPTGTSAFQLEADPAAVTHSIPLDLFKKGVRAADPRDHIPALSEPTFVPVSAAKSLPASARVIVLQIERDARAYPLDLLDRHELVNDVVAGRPVLVSWCPLCGSAVVYEREVEGHLLTFGVSGYLYKSDVLMFDRQTESFWSQLHQGAVAGPFTGTPLTVIPSYVTTLDAFRRARPHGRILHGGKGMLPARAYATSPYAGYADTPTIWFPVGPVRDDLPPKEPVIGIAHGEEAVAVPVAALAEAARSHKVHAHRVLVGGRLHVLRYDRAADAVVVEDEAAKPLHAIRLFWFAWAAFHPQTRVWTPEAR